MALQTVTSTDKSIDTSVKPPETDLSDDFDGGHNPEYSVFALVGLFPNRFFGDETAIDSLRADLSKGLEYVDELGRENIDKLLGLEYDEKDRTNGTILWAKTYKELKEGDKHSYLFEDCAIYTVDAQDRMYGNTYSIAAITRIGDMFYTFLTQQDFEDSQFSESGEKWAEAIARTVRGSWGNQRTGDKIVLPQAYIGGEPPIVTMKMPFHNYQSPPLTGGFEMFEERDEETLQRLHMYDKKLLTISKGLTGSLVDILSERNPAQIQSGSDLRYFIHRHLFPNVSSDAFVEIDQSRIPKHLSHYEMFQVR